MLLFKVISRCYDPGKTREVTRIVFFKITLFFFCSGGIKYVLLLLMVLYIPLW